MKRLFTGRKRFLAISVVTGFCLLICYIIFSLRGEDDTASVKRLTKERWQGVVSFTRIKTGYKWFDDAANSLIYRTKLLRSLRKAHKIDINYRHFDDQQFEKITCFESLESLYITSCKVTNLEPLTDLAQLKTLFVDGSKINDMSAISGHTRLVYIKMDLSEVSDISHLKNLTGLRTLSLEANEITDISALKELKNLEYLSLDSNQITDLSPLLSLKKLQTLSLYDNPLEPSEIDRLQKALPECKIFHDGKTEVASE